MLVVHFAATIESIVGSDLWRTLAISAVAIVGFVCPREMNRRIAHVIPGRRSAGFQAEGEQFSETVTDIRRFRMLYVVEMPPRPDPLSIGARALFSDQCLVCRAGRLGGSVWLFGLGLVGAAVVAGAVTDALITHRTLGDAIHSASSDADKGAIASIWEIFGDTLPPFERIILTNLSHGSGRAFTWPTVDGSILMNLGDLPTPLGAHSNLGYPAAGQLLIHELTHAWQIQNTSFLQGLICKGAVGIGKTYD